MIKFIILAAIMLAAGDCFAQTVPESTVLNNSDTEPSKLGSRLSPSLEKEVCILVNQVAFDLKAPKMAVIRSRRPLAPGTVFAVQDAMTLQTVFSGNISESGQVRDWDTTLFFASADFSSFNLPGNYRLILTTENTSFVSCDFQIGDHLLGKTVLPAILNFFEHQRASSPEEQEADRHLQLFGSEKTVDLHGGWCDASGDVSKYFSHLAYTNYMSPQQIPLVTWSMINAAENAGKLLNELNLKPGMEKEALYGADYIMRSLAPEGYFYMTVFSYFKKDPHERRVVGLLADSKTTADYQCAFREGGGMAVAALARISQWRKDGDFTSCQYLEAAIRAFDHLLKYSTQYADDHQDNIIDDYCALLAASELWMATNKELYKQEARRRANSLSARLSPEGYFWANKGSRPFWHASDAGLPIIALARYLDKENDKIYRTMALSVIERALDYNIRVTTEVTNPFGYPRQSFLYQGKIQDGFFIPHENESGWWWQGEDARLGSLAAAAIVGGRLVYPSNSYLGVKPELATYANRLVSWVLGCNPYNVCMMYGYGTYNVPYMASMYGHGSGKGGISNGITGKNGRGDGSGIDFKMEDNGNEWRWSEQWIPHSAWFLQAVTAMSACKK